MGKSQEMAQPVQKIEDVPCVYCPYSSCFNISHDNGEAPANT